MVSWSQVTAGFNPDDETVNFGKRLFAENNDSLYESVTVAIIEPDKETTNSPKISSLQHGRFCIRIDDSINVFENDSCQEILTSIGFDREISCYAMSSNKEFLFIVLEDFDFFCLNLPMYGKTVFTLNLKSFENLSFKIIKLCLMEIENKIDIYMVTEYGTIYCLENFDIRQINSLLNEDDIEFKNIIDQLTLSEVHKFQLYEICDITSSMLYEEFVIVIYGSNSLTIWFCNSKYYITQLYPHGYLKIGFLGNSKGLIALTTDNTIHVVCPLTLLEREVYNHAVEDFMILKDKDDEVVKILLLEKSNNSSIKTLCMVSFPDFTHIFQLNISNKVHLVNICDFIDSNILFIEEFNIINNKTNEIKRTVRIKALLETDHEYRLQRLVRSKKFDEAMIFAMQYGLSQETIHLSKIASIVEQTGFPEDKISEKINADVLINHLNKINNLEFIVQCCNKIFFSDFKELKKLLIYTRTRIMNENKEIQDNTVAQFLSSINNSLQRLETFELIEFNIQDTDNSIMKKWIKFSSSDMLEDFKTFLQMGEIEFATLIWNRHLSYNMENLNTEKIEEIFSVIPKDVDPLSLFPLLLHIIPSILFISRDVFNKLLGWAIKKTKSLEYYNYQSWPQSGIDFGNKLLKLFGLNTNLELSFSDLYTDSDSPLQHYKCLLQHLHDLQQLKINYRIKIPLNIFVGEPIEVCHVLLKKVHINELSNFIKNFLERYMLKNSLKNNYVFTNYIQKLLKNTNKYLNWEEKAVGIIDFISDIQEKSKYVISILRKASVPWTTSITNLAKENSNIDHASSSDIQNIINNVPVTLILKKYGFENIGLCNKLIHRIIKENRPNILSDLIELTTNDAFMRKEALSLYVIHNFNIGNIKDICNVADLLDVYNIVYCVDHLMNYIHMKCNQMKSFKLNPVNFEILQWLENKLKNDCLCVDKIFLYCQSVITRVHDLRSICLLKEEFDMIVDFPTFSHRKHELYEKYTNIKMLKGLDKCDVFSLALYKKFEKLLFILDFGRIDSSLVLLSEYNDIDMISNPIEDLEIDDSLSIKDYKLIHERVFKILRMTTVNKKMLNCLKRFYNRLLMICPPATTDLALIVCSWINLYSQCIENVSKKQNVNTPERKIDNWNLYSTYKDSTIYVDQSIISIFKDALMIQELLIKSMDSRPQIRNENIQQRNEIVFQMTHNIINKISRMNKTYSLLLIIQHFYIKCFKISDIHQSLNVLFEPILLNAVTTELTKLVNIGSPDIQFGLVYLHVLPITNGTSWITDFCKSYQLDYIRNPIVITLGKEYACLSENAALCGMFKAKLVLHIWAKRLTNFSIPYKEMILSDISIQTRILEDIMKSSSENVTQLLRNFCNDFQFKLDDCLMLYLSISIEKWDPNFIVNLINGRNEITVSNIEVDELRKKCNEIMANIKNKSAAKDFISKLIIRINFYHYEIFLILWDLLEEVNISLRSYIAFLQNYTRQGQPTSTEKEEWANLNLEYAHSSLPLIAQYRLPFIPKIRYLDIITPELNLKTYEKWLEIAPVLNIQQCIIRTLAIKGEVNTVWRKNSKDLNETWSLQPKNINLLNDIMKCIRGMEGSNALYYGTAALYYVVNHTPKGADQVAAAAECYSYALLAVQHTTFEAGMIEKIQFKYTRFTVEHILRTHDLNPTEYLSMIDVPLNLVRQLYMNESIPQRYKNVITHNPNINLAVKEISKIIKFNLMKLKFDLLQEWLQPDTNFFETSTTDMNVLKIDSDFDTTNGDNLLRARYILEDENVELFANYLINISFNNSDGYHHPIVKYRALCVLLSITNKDTLENLTKCDIISIRKYMKSLEYVSDLDYLGFSYDTESFDNCSKHELVYNLCDAKLHSPLALNLMSKICLSFNIYDLSIWDKCLTQMVKLNMVIELKQYLLQLQNQSHIISSRGYIEAWNLIISEPFKKLDLTPAPEQIDYCIESLCLLYHCPVINDLSFSYIINCCFQSHLLYLAAVLLPFLNNEEKCYTLQLLKKDVSKIIENLTKLSSKGILTISNSVKIINEEILQGSSKS